MMLDPKEDRYFLVSEHKGPSLARTGEAGPGAQRSTPFAAALRDNAFRLAIKHGWAATAAAAAGLTYVTKA